MVGHRGGDGGAAGCVVAAAGSGGGVVVVVGLVDDVDDLGADAELVDVATVTIVGLAVGGVSLLAVGVATGAGASAAAGVSGDDGADEHAGAHCTSITGAETITRRLGSLFIRSLDPLSSATAAWPRLLHRLPRTPTVVSGLPTG